MLKKMIQNDIFDNELILANINVNILFLIYNIFLKNPL